MELPDSVVSPQQVEFEQTAEFPADGRADEALIVTVAHLIGGRHSKRNATPTLWKACADHE